NEIIFRNSIMPLDGTNWSDRLHTNDGDISIPPAPPSSGNNPPPIVPQERKGPGGPGPGQPPSYAHTITNLTIWLGGTLAGGTYSPQAGVLLLVGTAFSTAATALVENVQHYQLLAQPDSRKNKGERFMERVVLSTAAAAVSMSIAA